VNRIEFAEPSASSGPGLLDRRLELRDTPGDDWCQIWCSPGAASHLYVHAPSPSVAAAQAPQVQARASGGHKVIPSAAEISREDILTQRVIAAMTLSAVAFQMSLFYIINHRDDDIKRYSLSVIGQTISIFCAVLSFSAAFAVVEDLWEGESELVQICMSPFFAVCFFIVMEIAVMIAARVRGEKAKKHVTLSMSKTRKLELKMPAHVLNAKTFGAGAAQMCAAATIRGFGHLQMVAYEREHSFFLLCLVGPFVFWGLFLFSWLVARVRRLVILWDGIVDQAEKTWIEVGEECEDEVIALSTGFHFAVALRVWVTDSLPFILLHGFEHRHDLEVATLHDVALLWLIGVTCAVFCCGGNWVAFGFLSHGINMNKLRSDSVSRIVRVFTMSIGMTFAWCACFGTHLLALHLPAAKEGLQLRLYIAIFQSIACFIVVLVLDFIADMKIAGPAFDKALVMLIQSFGTSVGLSWEQAFHECAEVAVAFMAQDESTPLFRASDDPKVWALFLSGVIVMAVLPAYRFYIVPRMYAMLEEHETELKNQEAKYTDQYRRSSVRSGDAPIIISETMFEWEEDTKLEVEQNWRPSNSLASDGGHLVRFGSMNSLASEANEGEVTEAEVAYMRESISGRG